MSKRPPPPGTPPAPPSALYDWHQLRLWQIQPIRDLLLIAAVLGLIYLGYVISIVTVPLLLAMMLAYLLEPLVQLVTRRFKFISRQGVAAALILIVGLVVIVPVVIGISFVFAWLRLASGSVWTGMLLHASHNLFIQGIFDPLTVDTGRTKWIIGEFGIGLAIIAVVMAIVVTRTVSESQGNGVASM